MKEHELKIIPEYFDALIREFKTFEVRFNDRNFEVGDIILFREYEPIPAISEDGINIYKPASGHYTGNVAVGRINYILSDQNYVKEGYIVFSFKLLSIQEATLFLKRKGFISNTKLV